MASVEIKLLRSNRVYMPSESLQGTVVVNSSSSFSHYGIRLSLSGAANLQIRGGSAGLLESFYGVINPVPIMSKSCEIKAAGKIPPGTTDFPFSIPLKQHSEGFEKFYETFHGTNINIQYLATVDVTRGYLHKSLSCTLEFIVVRDRVLAVERPISPEMSIFFITQDTQRHVLLPELKSGGFRVSGRIATQCSLSDPLTGELTVETSSLPILSIDIHLLCTESVLVGEKIVTENYLVQTTQIADGDVCRNFTMPIHVILPRLLTCPTTAAGPFSIEFKVSIVISFQSELSKTMEKSPTGPRLWAAMETLPLELVRTI